MGYQIYVVVQQLILISRQLRAEKEAVERAAHADTTPKKDYSLKEGQTINITIGSVGVSVQSCLYLVLPAY